jgi:hypothetical protein
MARVASVPETNEDPDTDTRKYPTFFRVDVKTIERTQGKNLHEVQAALQAKGHATKLATSQSWPKFPENGDAARLIVEMVSVRPSRKEVEPEPGEATAAAKQGAGFGDPETNPEVERAAVRFVTSHYKLQGWTVVSVENQKIGYDLRCMREAEVKHVEVKGVRGDEVCFQLTAGEKARAESDKLFCVCVVTRALADTPRSVEIPRARLLADYEFQPISYRVTKKG